MKKIHSWNRIVQLAEDFDSDDIQKLMLDLDS